MNAAALWCGSFSAAACCLAPCYCSSMRTPKTSPRKTGAKEGRAQPTNSRYIPHGHHTKRSDLAQHQGARAIWAQAHRTNPFGLGAGRCSNRLRSFARRQVLSCKKIKVGYMRYRISSAQQSTASVHARARATRTINHTDRSTNSNRR
jgi:hypothetical protein